MSYESIKNRYDKLFARPDIGDLIVEALQNQGVEFAETKQPYFVSTDCQLSFMDEYKINALDIYEENEELCIITQAA